MNSETLKLIITFLTGVGSAIILAFLGVKLERKKKESEKRHEHKAARYKAIILLMLWSLDFEKNKSWAHKVRTSLNNLQDLLDELDKEWKNMILYASDGVFKSMGKFVKNPTQDNFWETTLEMRRDLYGIQTKLSLEDFVEKATKK